MSNRIYETPHELFGPLSSPPNSLDEVGMLDGSVEDMKYFLEELTFLTGDIAESDGTPVVQLQFGKVLTKTSLQTVNDDSYLTITALLRPSNQSEYTLLSSQKPVLSSLSSSRQGEGNFLWDHNEGCYVLARRFHISTFPDERSVMDTIMDISDQAIAWFSFVRTSAKSLRN